MVKGNSMMLILVVAIVLVTSVSSSSAAMWALRQTPNPPPTGAPPDAGGEVAADTQAPAPKVTAGPNVEQDWSGGKIVYGKCEGATCSKCPAGSVTVSLVCPRKKTAKDKKRCWNPLSNTFSKMVCTDMEGCGTGQPGVVTDDALAGATGPMCPPGSSPASGNANACFNPQSLQISGLSSLEDIKSYLAAKKGGMKKMKAYFSKKNPSQAC